MKRLCPWVPISISSTAPSSMKWRISFSSFPQNDGVPVDEIILQGRLRLRAQISRELGLVRHDENRERPVRLVGEFGGNLQGALGGGLPSKATAMLSISTNVAGVTRTGLPAFRTTASAVEPSSTLRLRG